MSEFNLPSKPTQRSLHGFLAFAARLCAFFRGLLHDFRHRPRLPSVARALGTFRAWTARAHSTRATALKAANDRSTGATATQADLLHRHLAFEQTMNPHRPLVPGNKLSLLLNGPATYQSMTEAIAAARHHVHLETYIFDGDETGTQFADALIEQRAKGVEVAVIFDSVGSMRTPRAFFDRMRAAEIAVLEFNPLNPLSGRRDIWTFNHRDHRKLLVVDGRIAFIGGVNISKTYSSHPSGRRRRGRASATTTAGWRDTHLKIEGPVVSEFQKLFLETWARQHAEPPLDKDYFPTLSAQGNEIVRAIGSAADRDDSPIYLTLVSAIYRAQHHIHMTVAYFAPDRQLLRALIQAARRGVDVKLILPSNSDFWAIFHLGRSYYGRLLRGGVQVYEREGSVMHAKTLYIDGVWSTIGSSNMDLRSFLHNDEVNAVILGRDFAVQMESAFADDLRESRPISRQRWSRRSLLLRLKERVARVFAYWL